MPLSPAEARASVDRGILSLDQVKALSALSVELGSASILSMKNVLFFLGGLIAIGAISIWYTIHFTFTGWEIVALSAALGLGAALVTNYFLYTRNMPTPASVTAAFVVFAVTLAVFGLQVALGAWNEHVVYHAYHAYVDKRWLLMELATIAAGLVVVAVYRLPFITMPIALTLWYMSMDLTPLIAEWLRNQDVHFRESDWVSYWDLRLWVSVWFGLATIVAAFFVDIQTRGEKDFAFWPYLAGLLAFWLGLSLMHSTSEVSKFVYAMINVGLIFLGPFLMRKLFIVMGGMGLFLYLGEQAVRRFADSPAFLLVLLAIGATLMALGLLWYRYESAIEARTSWMVPRKLRERWAPV